MKKVILIYDPIKGESVPDGLCEFHAITLIKNGGEFRFSSGPFFDAFRLQVKKGLIKPEECEVWFQNDAKHEKVLIQMNAHGRCNTWPKGFCDYQEKFLSELLFN